MVAVTLVACHESTNQIKGIQIKLRESYGFDGIGAVPELATVGTTGAAPVPVPVPGVPGVPALFSFSKAGTVY